MRFDHFNIFRNNIKGKGNDQVGEFNIQGSVQDNGNLHFVK